MNYILDSKVNSLIGISDDKQVSLYSSEYGNIDYLYIVKEAGELDYYGQKYDVEVGDIILRLYSRSEDSNKREIVIIPAVYAKPWVDNMTMRRETENKLEAQAASIAPEY